jgi:Uma2 family endonuclease
MAEAAHGQKEPKRRATYEDLLRVPDNKVAELLDGELVVSPRPAARHARAASGLGVGLGPFDFGSGPGGKEPGGWWVLDEPELHLGKDVLVPDLAGWRRTRMPIIPDVAAFELAPDWVCEVVSPSTVRHDRLRKMRIYARESVAHLWLVDPIAQTLEVYRLEGGRWVVFGTFGGDEKVRAEPFDAIELDLARLWLEEAPPAAAPEGAMQGGEEK